MSEAYWEKWGPHERWAESAINLKGWSYKYGEQKWDSFDKLFCCVLDIITVARQFKYNSSENDFLVDILINTIERYDKEIKLVANKDLPEGG